MDTQAVKDALFEALLAVLMTRFPSVDERWALLRARHEAEKVLEQAILQRRGRNGREGGRVGFPKRLMAVRREP